jgi:hypothetical protein
MDRLYNIAWSVIGIGLSGHKDYIYIVYMLSFAVMVELSRFQFEYVHTLVLLPLLILFHNLNRYLYIFNIVVHLFPNVYIVVYMKSLFLYVCSGLSYLKWVMMVCMVVYTMRKWFEEKQKKLEEYGAYGIAD